MALTEALLLQRCAGDKFVSTLPLGSQLMTTSKAGLPMHRKVGGFLNESRRMDYEMLDIDFDDWIGNRCNFGRRRCANEFITTAEASSRFDQQFHDLYEFQLEVESLSTTGARSAFHGNEPQSVDNTGADGSQSRILAARSPEARSLQDGPLQHDRDRARGLR